MSLLLWTKVNVYLKSVNIFWLRGKGVKAYYWHKITKQTRERTVHTSIKTASQKDKNKHNKITNATLSTKQFYSLTSYLLNGQSGIRLNHMIYCSTIVLKVAIEGRANFGVSLMQSQPLFNFLIHLMSVSYDISFCSWTIQNSSKNFADTPSWHRIFIYARILADYTLLLSAILHIGYQPSTRSTVLERPAHKCHGSLRAQSARIYSWSPYEGLFKTDRPKH